MHGALSVAQAGALCVERQEDEPVASPIPEDAARYSRYPLAGTFLDHQLRARTSSTLHGGFPPYPSRSALANRDNPRPSTSCRCGRALEASAPLPFVPFVPWRCGANRRLRLLGTPASHGEAREEAGRRAGIRVNQTTVARLVPPCYGVASSGWTLTFHGDCGFRLKGRSQRRPEKVCDACRLVGRLVRALLAVIISLVSTTKSAGLCPELV